MHPISKVLLVAGLSAGACTVRAQYLDFSLEGRPVQIHGFASQAFVASNQNNYLTMDTSKGSFAFTDFGGNISVQLNSKFRVGAQIYDRNLGQLGRWHPQLDWATADYKFKDWFGIRVGKVKTTLGLYNETQDQESLYTWAILPQSMYPLDLRSIYIAHMGGDFYGNINLKRLGSLSYTAYAGLISDDPYGGYVYGEKAFGADISTLNARGEGGDLRWNTPLLGLLGGVSYQKESAHVHGTASSYTLRANAGDETSQFYVQYVRGGLTLAAEYRRSVTDSRVPPSTADIILDSRSVYGAASYRISKRFELGGYYSRYYPDFRLPDLDGPANHIFDRVATLRVDLTSFWDVKIEGHFINGNATSVIFQGFYPQNNPQGYQPTTNMLIIRTGICF